MSGKLKGIYDALDHGQFKVACKLCSSFLQKQPAHALARALHAVALERCGRRDEAIRLCEETIAGEKSLAWDETTMNTLQVVLRRCRHWDTILQMYEASWIKEDSEELGVLVFLTAVHMREHLKAQQVAMKLYQKKKGQNYLLWVIAAILLQVRQGSSAKPLELASMMLQKAPLDAKAKGGSFNRGQLYLFFLHLGTLQLQQKQAEALDLLEEWRGLLKLQSDHSALRLQLLCEAGRPKEAVRQARQQFLKNPGSWVYAQDYARLVMDLPGAELLELGEVQDESLDALEAQQGDDEVRNALLLFRHFQLKEDSGASGGAKRIALLAELELRRCAAARAGSALASKEVMSLLTSFIQHFSGRAHCFFDLAPHLTHLSAADALPLLAAQPQGPEAAVLAARLRRGFRRRSGGDAAAEVLEAKRLLETWQELGGVEGPDALLLLAVVALIEADHCSKEKHRQHLLDAAAVAQMGLAQQPHVFGFKVLLLLIFDALDLPGLMMKLYMTMDIKNIQHESLSYLVMDALICPEQIQQVCRNIQAFHEDLDKDGGEALSAAFQMPGVLCRAPEYVDGIAQVSRSLMWGKSIAEETACELAAASWETLECRQLRVLRVVAEQSTWAWRNQDRALLNGLQPLPELEPRELLKDKEALRAQPAALTSFASSWSCNSTASTARRGGGAAEALLFSDDQGLGFRVWARVLYAAGLLTKEAAEEELSAAVRGACEALESLESLAASEGLETRDVPVYAQVSSVKAIEMALLAKAEAWPELTERLELLTASLGRVLQQLRSSSLAPPPREGCEEPSAAAGSRRGVSAMLKCFSVLVVVGLWLLGVLPKGSKKAKGEVHSCRAALKDFLQQLQRISELQNDLLAAQQQPPALPESNFSSLEIFQAQVKELQAQIGEARQLHLKQLHEQLALRLQLLKSRGVFKP